MKTPVSLSNRVEWKKHREFGELPIPEVLTTIAEEAEGRLVVHHAVHTRHPATSHRGIFPQCAVQRPIPAKEPEQQLLLLRPEGNTQSKW